MILITLIVIRPNNIIPSAPGASTSIPQWAWATNSISLYLVFLGNWLNQQISEMGIWWSICVEEQFYLFLPFLILLINKKILFIIPNFNNSYIDIYFLYQQNK